MTDGGTAAKLCLKMASSTVKDGCEDVVFGIEAVHVNLFIILLIGRNMYKNHLQELAQRSYFNLLSFACIRERPDHAPRFKASVNFNGEIFDISSYCTTLRQDEHAATEVAFNLLSTRVPSRFSSCKLIPSLHLMLLITI
ncbi:hypothetical protein RJ640_002861 [Escallonia rubra]|uniref:DRBM domain-containing protein n=1 Tax=Escallonia rubra TaxID=112253 RepID=A0AA88RDA4_9ASTE|nr:hypothetical protein RJ640_002861 [Escallonia rubra]